MIETIPQRIYIPTYDEYADALIDGNQPLFEWKKFDMNFELRQQIQNELFGKSTLGKGDVLRANDKYYHWCFENKLQICEECCAPIQGYSAKFISHILTRGAYAELAHDPRNSRILCYDCHCAAEDETTHCKMKIWQADQLIIQILNHEY